MIELVQDLRAINVLAKFENDPWKIMDVRVLTGLSALPPAHPLGVPQYPGALEGCGVKNQLVNPSKMTKFTSICTFSWFLLCTASQLQWPLTSEAGTTGQSAPILGVTWLAKWRGGMGHPGRQGVPTACQAITTTLARLPGISRNDRRATTFVGRSCPPNLYFENLGNKRFPASTSC